MKFKRFSVVFSGLMLLWLAAAIAESKLYSWGFFGHKLINHQAVYSLPTELSGFYKSNHEFITEHAVDPDKRRYGVPEEAPRHYIDLDHYGAIDSVFQVVPKKWNDAVAKYSEDTLQAYGIVPWHIQVMLRRLEYAFKQEDVDYILHVSADLGHYIADAHVPLHTTENYNGQMTNQYGIHGFWESRVPELFSNEYDMWVGKAEYIKDPLETTWAFVHESHMALDSVLSFERELNKRFPTDQKYSFESRGTQMVKVYSYEYSKAYSQMLDGMVERRIRAATIMVANLWYTAWVNAGKPDVLKFRDKKISEKLLEMLEKETKANDQIKTRDHEH